MASLFQIASDHMALNDLIEEQGGELDGPEVVAAFDALMRELQDNQGAKLESLIQWEKQLKMEAVAAGAEAEQWATRARVRDNRRERIRKIIKEFMEGTAQPKITTPHGFQLRIQNNGGKYPVNRAEIIDPAKVPDNLVMIRREVDWDAVYTYLTVPAVPAVVDEDGKQVEPPIYNKLDFANLLPRGTHLRIV